MIKIENQLYESIHDYLTQMTENLGEDWDHHGTLEEAVQDEVLKAYIGALKSAQVEDINGAINKAYREVINHDLGPVLHLVRKRASNGTLTEELLEIYATILAEDFEQIIKEYAG